MTKKVLYFLVFLLLATPLSAAAVFAQEDASSESTDQEETEEDSSGSDASEDTDTGSEEDVTEDIDISGASVTLSASTYTYNGSARKPTPTVKLTLNGSTKTLTNGTDYSVSYSSNTNVGTATVKITGKNNFTGTVSKTFTIRPKSTKLSSLTGISKGFTAKWSSVSAQVSGYQIQYATNKSFTKGKGTETISGKSKKKAYVTSVKANKTYYVRIRTYKTVNGKKYYSAWSSYKKVKTLKRVTVFAGDSLMTGVAAYGFDYMDISGTVKSAAYTSLNTVTFRTTKTKNGQTCFQKIVSAQPYRIYIMLGMNEVTWKSTSAIESDYETLIKKIQAKCPAADIVILALSPVSKSKASSVKGFRKIDAYNESLQNVAEACGVTYYDYTAAFKTSSGYLKSKYNGGDGIHWSRAGYQKFAEVISKYDATLK